MRRERLLNARQNLTAATALSSKERSKKRLTNKLFCNAAAIVLAPWVVFSAFAAEMALKFAGVLRVEHYAHNTMEQVKTDIESRQP